MTALDAAVVEGLRQRVADLEARLAATEDAERLATNRAVAAEGALRALVEAELHSHRYDVDAAIEAAESLLREMP